MKDKDMLTDLEFDGLLLDLADAPPPPEVSDALSPWRSAMSRIVWGIGWSTITVKLLYLDYLLPAVGTIMVLLGFRSLRRENRWFAIGYGCAWAKLVWWVLNFSIGLTVFQNDDAVLDFQRSMGYLMLVPTFGLFLGLRNGIRAVQRRAELPEEGGTGLLVCQVIMVLLALIRFSGWPALIFFVIYILTLRELYRTSKSMEEAGYAVSPAPVRFSDSSVKKAYTAAIAVTALVCCLFLAKYPMDWQPAGQPTGDAVRTVRQELLDLGFPEEVLKDLTEEEILACSGADFVLSETEDHIIERKHIVSLNLDQQEGLLRITSVGLRYPGERDRWKLIHHFRWVSGDSFCGTEAIQLWPAYQSGNWNFSGEFTGRVLYDREGETFTSSYHFLGTRTTSGFFWLSEDVYAAFSLPGRGENQRGYLIYEAEASTVPSASVTSWFNYVHQYSRLQFPVKTALEAERNGNPNSGWCFFTEQTEFHIANFGELPSLI